MTSFIITWLVTTVSLIIISKLNVGIHIADFTHALIAGLVIGLINAFIQPIAQVLALPLTVLTLGIFYFIVNALLFGLAAWIVQGFSLRHRFWSALIGSLLLSILNSIIFWILGAVGIG